MKNGFRASELRRKLRYSGRFFYLFNRYGTIYHKQFAWREKLDDRIKYNIKLDFENFFKKGNIW